MRLRAVGVMGDFGVLSPDCDVEVKGEEGGLSILEVEDCLDLRSDVSCDVMAMGEAELSMLWGSMVGVPLVSSLVQVTMFMLSSCGRSTFPPG